MNEPHRATVVTSLMESVSKLTENILDGKLEGEEATHIDTAMFSSTGARTTTSAMSRYNLMNMNELNMSISV